MTPIINKTVFLGGFFMIVLFFAGWIFVALATVFALTKRLPVLIAALSSLNSFVTALFLPYPLPCAAVFLLSCAILFGVAAVTAVCIKRK